MSWKTRYLQYPGTTLHLYNRGVDRGTLFFRDVDYERFLELLAYSLNDDILILGYTLMPNHFHLVVRQKKPYAASWYLRAVCGAYSREINRRRPRTGHLFQGRFRVQLVEDDAGLLRLSHYIHRNPVTAGLVKHPSDWRYSSFNEYVSGASAGFLSVDPILTIVGGRENYARFMTEYDPATPGSVSRFLKPR